MICFSLGWIFIKLFRYETLMKHNEAIFLHRFRLYMLSFTFIFIYFDLFWLIWGQCLAAARIFICSILRIYGLFSIVIDAKHYKNEQLHGRETYRHGHIVIVFILCVAFGGRRHLGLGYLDCCLQIGDSLWVWVWVT